MQVGQSVKVIDYRGKKLVRRVVAVIGDVVLVCLPEEYELALKHRSLPWCVGFKRQRVLDT